MSSDINNSTVLFQDKTRQTAGQVFQGYYNNSLNLKKRIEALESGTNEGENLLGFTEVNDTVVWLDMRLGAPFGTLASNATAPQYKASKPIAITAGTYRLMGAGIGIYTSASNPIARISLASAYTANQITPIADSLEIERLTEIGSSIHEFKVTVKHDGYFVVDTFTNVAGTTFSGEIILQKIIGGGGDNGGGNAIDEHALLLAKYTDVDAFHYGDILSKMPKFKKAWKEKNQDIIIVGTGTSLMSRSTEHCTLRPDAKTRPPLLHSNNLASLIWDSLKWEGQEYRRYDSGFFVETGSGWQTSATHGDWDDSTAHDGLTRYSDQSGSTFSFTIPANAKSCNLIGRLDLNGTENAVIAVSEGNGVLQVWDENAGGTPAINLLENVTIADVIVDQRLGGMNANLTTNSSTPTYVASKPFFVKAGNYFVTGLGIGVYQPGSTPNMRASLWASISGGLPQGSPIANATSMVALTAAGSSPHQFILTVNQDGYIIIDMASNVAQTQLTGTATMIEQSEQSGEGAWVEANNYQFSMKNKPIKKVNFSHVNPINGVTDTYTDFPVTGNTTYQKRVVKLRAVDPSTTKTCTISRTNGRLLYWGVEYSPRPYMITYINSARGAHGVRPAEVQSLLKFQNELWAHQPTCVITENPIHNSGGGHATYTAWPTSYWKNTIDQFLFDLPVSLEQQAAEWGIDVPELEWCFFTLCISVNFNGINDDGTLKVTRNADGIGLTALDAQMITNEAIREHHPDAIVIDAVKTWVDAGNALFNGNLKDATAASGKTGPSFTNDGSHPNDIGSRVLGRAICPVFRFDR